MRGNEDAGFGGGDFPPGSAFHQERSEFVPKRRLQKIAEFPVEYLFCRRTEKGGTTRVYPEYLLLLVQQDTGIGIDLKEIDRQRGFESVF